MKEMRIHIPANENIIDSLQSVIDFLKHNAGDYPLVSQSGINAYFSLQSEDGELSPLNNSNILIKDGKVVDLKQKLINIAREEFIKSMRKVANDMLRHYTVDVIVEDYRLVSEKLQKVQVKKNHLESESVKKQNREEAERLQEELDDLKYLKDHASELESICRSILQCIDEGKVTWSMHFICDKSEYDLTELRVRPEIDKDATVLERPYYYYKKDGYSTKNIEDTTQWFRIPIKGKYGLMRQVYYR